MGWLIAVGHEDIFGEFWAEVVGFSVEEGEDPLFGCFSIEYSVSSEEIVAFVVGGSEEVFSVSD